MNAPFPALSLVIPAYNEAGVIARAVAEAEAALNSLFSDFEIIVVDDGSTDGTTEVLCAGLPGAPHMKLVLHPENRGYGAALRTGFEAATSDFIAFTDADCQFDLRELGPMTEIARHVPIVAGYRKDRKDSRRRCFYSRVYNRLVRALLGTRVRDCDCALKVFRRDALMKLLPETRGFFVNAEMLTRARLLDLNVAETPVAHRPRLGGNSKVSLWDIPRTLRTLLAFWWTTLVRGKTPAPPKLAVLQTRITIVDLEPLEVPEPVASRLPSIERGSRVAHPGPRQEAA